MTPPLSDKKERISLEDIALVQKLLRYMCESRCRTYEFGIASDMLTDSEVTQS